VSVAGSDELDILQRMGEKQVRKPAFSHIASFVVKYYFF
jgi:hypothetical protein